MRKELYNAIHQYCANQAELLELEKYVASLQGKGWGTATTDPEVDNCVALVNGEPNVLIDIGANKGLYTESILRRFPGTECHIFEPAAANLEVLNQKFGSLDNVFINGEALSNAAGTFTLYTNEPGSGLASLTKRNISHVNKTMDIEETIQTMRFDEYWKGGDVDYVKIDVEGHELDVLEGFGDLLLKTKLVQFEFGGCNVDTKSHFRDFWYYFKDRNFDLYRITPYGPNKLERYTEYDEHYMTTNYIALNQS